MKIYIAGRITNNPTYITEFKEAEQFIKGHGHTPINPVQDEGRNYKDYIDDGLKKLMECDAIYMLPYWQRSMGASLEHHYARVAGLKIYQAITDELPTAA